MAGQTSAAGRSQKAGQFCMAAVTRFCSTTVNEVLMLLLFFFGLIV